jgi:hypothetical protein
VKVDILGRSSSPETSFGAQPYQRGTAQQEHLQLPVLRRGTRHASESLNRSREHQTTVASRSEASSHGCANIRRKRSSHSEHSADPLQGCRRSSRDAWEVELLLHPVSNGTCTGLCGTILHRTERCCSLLTCRFQTNSTWAKVGSRLAITKAGTLDGKILMIQLK